MLNVLRIDSTPIILRDELDPEDLICLLDLLHGATTLENYPVEITVGYERPPRRKEEAQP